MDNIDSFAITSPPHISMLINLHIISFPPASVIANCVSELPDVEDPSLAITEKIFYLARYNNGFW